MGLDTVELVLDVEKHFDIELSDSELEKIETVEELCNLVRKHSIKKQGFKSPSYSLIYHSIVKLLNNNYSIPLLEIQPHSKFVRDLGLD